MPFCYYLFTNGFNSSRFSISNSCLLYTSSRVYNFSAGPAVLPEEVLKEVAEEMMDYQGTGMSVMEMSHRSADFQKIIDEAEQDLRDLMKIPDNYKVLFLQGGASQDVYKRQAVTCRTGISDLCVFGKQFIDFFNRTDGSF